MNRNQRGRQEDEEMITLPSGDRIPIRLLDQDISGDCYKRSDRLIIDKLPTVTGSIAGSNSRFFQDYKRHREVEMNRLIQMEKDGQCADANRAFEEQRDTRKRQLEEEAWKKRERRTRRKAAHPKGELGLPAEVIREIKESERTERDAPSEKRPHPYSMNGLVMEAPRAQTFQTSDTFPPPTNRKVVQPSISIIEED